MSKPDGADELSSHSIAQQHLKSLVGLNSSVTKKCRAALHELTAVHQRFEEKQQQAPSLERCENVAARLASQPFALKQQGTHSPDSGSSPFRDKVEPFGQLRHPGVPGELLREHSSDSQHKLDKASEKFEALQSELLTSRQRLEQCEQITASHVSQLQNEAATSRSLGLRAMENVAQELAATQSQLASSSFVPQQADVEATPVSPGVDDDPQSRRPSFVKHMEHGKQPNSNFSPRTQVVPQSGFHSAASSLIQRFSVQQSQRQPSGLLSIPTSPVGPFQLPAAPLSRGASPLPQPGLPSLADPPANDAQAGQSGGGLSSFQRALDRLSPNPTPPWRPSLLGSEPMSVQSIEATEHKEEPHGSSLRLQLDEPSLAQHPASPSMAAASRVSSYLEKPPVFSQAVASSSPRNSPRNSPRVSPRDTPRGFSPLSKMTKPFQPPRPSWQPMLFSPRMVQSQFQTAGRQTQAAAVEEANREANREAAHLRTELAERSRDLQGYQQLSEAREELAAERSAREADQIRLELGSLKQQLQEARKKEQEKESKRPLKDSEQLVTECESRSKDIHVLRSELALAEQRAQDLEHHVADSVRANNEISASAERDREAAQSARREAEDLRKKVDKAEKQLREFERETANQSAKSELESAVAKEREKAEILRRENEIQSLQSEHGIILKGYQREHQSVEKRAEHEEQLAQKVKFELRELNQEIQSVRSESLQCTKDAGDQERSLRRELDQIGFELKQEAHQCIGFKDEVASAQLERDLLRTQNSELEQDLSDLEEKQKLAVTGRTQEAAELEEVRAELTETLERAEHSQSQAQMEAERQLNLTADIPRDIGSLLNSPRPSPRPSPRGKIEDGAQQFPGYPDGELAGGALGSTLPGVDLGSTTASAMLAEAEDSPNPQQIRDRDRLELSIVRRNPEELDHAIQVAERVGVKGDLVERAKASLALVRQTTLWSYEPAIFQKLRLKDAPDKQALPTPYSLIPEDVFQVSEMVPKEMEEAKFLCLADGRGWASRQDVENDCPNCVCHKNLLVTGSQGMVACLWDLDGGLNDRAKEVAKEIEKKRKEEEAARAKAKAKGKAKAKAKAEAAPTPLAPPEAEAEVEEKCEKPAGKLLRKFLHLGKVNSVVAEGQQLATGSADSFARVWDIGTGAELCRFRHGDSVWSVALSGRRLATGSADKTARVWDLDSDTDQELLRFQHDGEVRAVAFTSGQGPASMQLATGAADNKAKLWSLETAQEVQSFQHDGWVLAVCFAGQQLDQLVTGAADKLVRLWNSSNGDLIHTIPHQGSVNCVMWSEETQLLATGCEDQYARLWKLDGSLSCEIPHDGPVNSVFARGNALVTAAVELPSSDKVAKLWDCKGKDVEMIRQFQHLDQVRSVWVIVR